MRLNSPLNALVQPGHQRRQKLAQRRRPFGVLGATGVVELEIARLDSRCGQGLRAKRRSAAWATCWAGSTVTQPHGSTSCSPGIGKAGLQIGCVSAAYEEATMARGSKVFRPADLSESNASSYPEPFRG